jgi:hypothetical protein
VCTVYLGSVVIILVLRDLGYRRHGPETIEEMFVEFSSRRLPALVGERAVSDLRDLCAYVSDRGSKFELRFRARVLKALP